MKNQRDKLHQYQKRITILTTRETEIARECLRAGRKSQALLALRRKKYQESLLATTDAQLAQLETLTADVEFALVQKDVLFGLQQGTRVLKDIQREMGGVERVEMILGESAEARAYQNVSGLLSSGDFGEFRNADWAWFADGVGDRKLAICWRIACLIRMRTRLRMSWKRWRGRLRVSRRSYLTRRMLSRRICRTFRKRLWRRRRRGGGRKGRRERRLPSRWRPDDTVEEHRTLDSALQAFSDWNLAYLGSLELSSYNTM
nr:charged multivesicular body protein 6 [Quercus suber]